MCAEIPECNFILPGDEHISIYRSMCVCATGLMMECDLCHQSQLATAFVRYAPPHGLGGGSMMVSIGTVADIREHPDTCLSCTARDRLAA